MTRQSSDSPRIVHVDPDEFGTTSIEEALFREAFPDMTFEAKELTGEELATKVGPADALLTHYTPVGREAIDAIRPSVIVRYATGYDGIDLDYATQQGVQIVNVPTYCDEEVADHVFATALALIRGLPQFNADVARGNWNWRLVCPRGRLSDYTFGFLGFGRKARATAERVGAIGCPMLAYDPHMPAEAIREHGAEPVGLDDLLSRSQVLSIHVPLTDETEGLIDAAALAKLPRGAILINSARGRVLDEQALLDALDSGHIAGAGLDVLVQEPPDPKNPLLGRDDVIVTPHAAWYSASAEERVCRLGTEYAIAALRGEESIGLVNPEALKKR